MLRPDELSLNIGARVYVLEKFLDGWWQVAFVDDQQQQIIGLYPSNFLHEENQQQQQQNLISSNSKTVVYNFFHFKLFVNSNL